MLRFIVAFMSLFISMAFVVKLARTFTGPDSYCAPRASSAFLRFLFLGRPGNYLPSIEYWISSTRIEVLLRVGLYFTIKSLNVLKFSEI